MSITITGIQNLAKNCFAYAEDLDIALISNGEAPVSVISSRGTYSSAGIVSPASGPTIGDNGAGNLTNGQFAAYVFVYVSKNIFPFLVTLNDGGGSFAPRSNPSVAVVREYTGSGNRQVRVTVPFSPNNLVTDIWVYRTSLFASSALASQNAAAGNLYFLAEVANPNSGTTFIDDNTLIVVANGLIELTNFSAPQFKFCVYDGEYFWGFGNQPFKAVVTWLTDGTVTLQNTPTDGFFGGRDGQFITFEGLETGGINNQGVFYFKQTSISAGYVYTNTTTQSQVTIPVGGTALATIQGDGATLYRSAFKNPLSWGFNQIIGGIPVPTLWTLKVGGSIGTAIALVPDQSLLKLDMEFPASCVTYNLQAAATTSFARTKQLVSKIYSTTSHFSQFQAVSNGRNVLWSMDYKNNAIIQFDGVNQFPVSINIPDVLRDLTTNRKLQLLSHGLYDPTTELNILWVTSNQNGNWKIDRCIFNHWPTDSWGVVDDYDILSSATIEDTNSSQRISLVGTESGFLGRAFDPSTNGNWLPTSLKEGTVISTDGTSITTEGFFGSEDGIDGNYVRIISANSLDTVVRRITSHTGTTLVLDAAINTSLFNEGAKFFTGQIQLSVLKYIDENQPNVDKAIEEIWVTLENVDQNNLPYIRYYSEHSTVPSRIMPLTRDKLTDTYKAKVRFPNLRNKVIGVELIDNSFNAVKFSNLVLTFN